MLTREQVHAAVRSEAEKIVGTVQYINWATCFHNTRAESGDFEFDPPIAVRVFKPMDDDLFRWNDNNVCDPVYPISALDPTRQPKDWHLSFCYGSPRYLDGTVERSDFVADPFRFTVDGTMPDGTLQGFAEARAPYAVHDAGRQDWIVTGLRWRWQARAVQWLAERGMWPGCA